MLHRRFCWAPRLLGGRFEFVPILRARGLLGSSLVVTGRPFFGGSGSNDELIMSSSMRCTVHGWSLLRWAALVASLKVQRSARPWFHSHTELLSFGRSLLA